MIYYILHEHLNIIQYISFRAIGAAITALMISFLIGPKIIRTLTNHRFEINPIMHARYVNDCYKRHGLSTG